MALPHPYQAYQLNAVQTASPERLLLMLYDGCIRFLHLAKKALQENNLEQVHHNLIKAQNIISEWMATLNMDYEISHQLLPLYDYLRRRLIEANMQKKVEPIDEVLGIVTDLRATWEEAAKRAKQATGATAGQDVRL